MDETKVLLAKAERIVELFRQAREIEQKLVKAAGPDRKEENFKEVFKILKDEYNKKSAEIGALKKENDWVLLSLKLLVALNIRMDSIENHLRKLDTKEDIHHNLY